MAEAALLGEVSGGDQNISKINFPIEHNLINWIILHNVLIGLILLVLLLGYFWQKRLSNYCTGAKGERSANFDIFSFIINFFFY